MLRRDIFGLTLFLAFQSTGNARQDITGFKFGSLKKLPSGGYTLRAETTRIPRLMKSTGFRFGVQFENPTCRRIEWYEQFYFLSAPNQTVVTTPSETSSDPVVTDAFWIDDTDPPGLYRMELFIDGLEMFRITFEVVST